MGIKLSFYDANGKSCQSQIKFPINTGNILTLTHRVNITACLLHAQKMIIIMWGLWNARKINFTDLNTRVLHAYRVHFHREKQFIEAGCFKGLLVAFTWSHSIWTCLANQLNQWYLTTQWHACFSASIHHRHINTCMDGWLVNWLEK